LSAAPRTRDFRLTPAQAAPLRPSLAAAPRRLPALGAQRWAPVPALALLLLLVLLNAPGGAPSASPATLNVMRTTTDLAAPALAGGTSPPVIFAPLNGAAPRMTTPVLPPCPATNLPSPTPLLVDGLSLSPSPSPSPSPGIPTGAPSPSSPCAPALPSSP
jgi:hypothetical protein